eukprot:scaffold534600_cov17-Prasinocladus_malaysianus.AAC.1
MRQASKPNVSLPLCYLLHYHGYTTFRQHDAARSSSPACAIGAAAAAFRPTGYHANNNPPLLIATRDLKFRCP